MANFNMGDIDLGSGGNLDDFLSSPSNGQGGVFVTSPILQAIASGSPQSAFEMESIQTQGSPGIDALFEQHPQLVGAATSRKVVANVGDLKPFMRLSAETLIHKSTQDLWGLRKESDGKFYIERLFDDNGSPLKG